MTKLSRGTINIFLQYSQVVVRCVCVCVCGGQLASTEFNYTGGTCTFHPMHTV